MKTLWFVNYSHTSKQRTTDVKVFYKLMDVKQFISNNNISGYVIRQKSKNELLFHFNDFIPSATEHLRIENIKKV